MPRAAHGLILDETAEVFRRGSADGVVIGGSPAGVSIKPGSPTRASRESFRQGVYTSRVIRTDFAFNEVVASYNVQVPAQCGFAVELRFRRSGTVRWTPFYWLGVWGSSSPAWPWPKHLRDANGAVEVDLFRSDRLFDRIQYRIHLWSRQSRRSPWLRRFALAYSRTISLACSNPAPLASCEAEQAWTRRLPVPFFSQRALPADLRDRACGPTSARMVLAYYGIDVPAGTLAETIYDPEHKIYGNWARIVQAAYTFGLPGYVERFSDWAKVRRYIACGQPIIASISIRPGQLCGAPYKQTEGHLLVITGFDRQGNVHVNDPAAPSARQGCLTYAREEMERAWFGHGGAACLLLAPSDAASAHNG